MALGATALVTLAVAKAHLRLTVATDDTMIERIIEGVSKHIHRYLDRIIPSQSYTPILDVRQGCIVLDQMDVTAVTAVQTESEEALRVKYTGTDTHARVEVTSTGVTTVTRVGATTTTTSSTFAANVTTAAMVTTIDAIADWTATTLLSRPSAFLIRQGPYVAKDVDVTLAVWVDSDDEYNLDYDAGIITGVIGECGAPTFSRARVEFTAGYTTVPEDVQLVALEMITRSYLNVATNPELQSEHLDDYSYVRGTLGVAAESMKGWREKLRSYKRETG